MAISTANELRLNIVRSLTSCLDIGAEFYSKTTIPVRSKLLDSGKSIRKGKTVSEAKLGVRWSNILADGSVLNNEKVPLPLELTGYIAFGDHWGATAAVMLWKDRVNLAATWKQRFANHDQKFAVGMRFHFHAAEVPAFVKLSVSSYAGIAAFLGARFSGCIGIGAGLTHDPVTTLTRAGLFLNI